MHTSHILHDEKNLLHVSMFLLSIAVNAFNECHAGTFIQQIWPVQLWSYML